MFCLYEGRSTNVWKSATESFCVNRCCGILNFNTLSKQCVIKLKCLMKCQIKPRQLFTSRYVTKCHNKNDSVMNKTFWLAVKVHEKEPSW